MRKLLLIFCFETGDAFVPYWDEAAVIDIYDNTSVRGLCNEVEDSFSSYLESDVSEEKSHQNMVKDVLDASGYTWERVYAKVPAVDAFRILFI